MVARPIAPGATIAVVGAGIVGVTTAFALAERGYRVTLYDRDAPGRTGPSFGNAGHVVGSAIFPLATPGIGMQGLRMLADPDGPLKVPTAYAARLAPWLWRFWRSSYGAAYERSLAALIALNAGLVEEAEAFYARAGVGQVISRAPALYLYESEQSYAAARKDWAERERHGFHSTMVDAAGIRELEPNLAPIFARGVISHEWSIVTDPQEAVDALFEAARARGVTYERQAVTRIAGSGDGASVATGSAATRFDAVVVAAGVWSRPLADSLGEKLPVEAERGYNLTFPGLQSRINRPMVFADRGVVATALIPGLRIGGWTELGGTELPPTARYWDKMREISAALFPGLERAEAVQWMGHRPSMPDSVPVISRSSRNDAVFYATGHGHYGLSQSTRTARAIVELIADAADETWAAHSIRRFN